MIGCAELIAKFLFVQIQNRVLIQVARYENLVKILLNFLLKFTELLMKTGQCRSPIRMLCVLILVFELK